MPTRKEKAIVWRGVALAVVGFSAALSPSALAQNNGADKTERTARFWQLDPQANFPNQGSNHCAPTSVADGLVYLQNARGLEGLMKSTDHDGQIALITQLAAAMNTDPKAGTGPNEIVTGLRRYITARGYSFERLEVATWRPLGASNKKYVVAAKPDLKWLTAAVHDPDTVVICNFGWYQKQKDGAYKRLGGHWVNCVATGADKAEFEIHNPAMKPALQKTKTSITLSALGNDFISIKAGGKHSNMAGYYRAEGPGMGLGNSTVAAVLDGVIVFKIATG